MSAEILTKLRGRYMVHCKDLLPSTGVLTILSTVLTELTPINLLKLSLFNQRIQKFWMPLKVRNTLYHAHTSGHTQALECTKQ
jgi:hypothetical protein